MALPDPFNTVEDLVLWSGFRQGASEGQASVLQGTFAYSQFETALAEARREIYRATLQAENDDFAEDRQDELKEAERYLATARLVPNFASRMQIAFPESNLQSVGEVMSGADTPSPYEKGAQWINVMYQRLRAIGLELLHAPAHRYSIHVGQDDRSDSFPCLSSLDHCQGVSVCCGCQPC